MKGVVFTEFLDFVELRHGYETVDAMLEIAAPRSAGVYTAVGSYEFSEMAALLMALSQVSQTPVADLLQAFGRHLFGRLAALYPAFVENFDDPLDFLETVGGRIHVEVVKLYPDAEVPRIDARRIGLDMLTMTYRSCRPLGQFCIGLIQGCGKHFKTDLLIRSSWESDGLDITIRRMSAGLFRPEARP